MWLKKNFSAKFQRFRAIQGSDSDESDDDVDDEMFEDNDFDWNVKKFVDALKDRLMFNECSKLLIFQNSNSKFNSMQLFSIPLVIFTKCSMKYKWLRLSNCILEAIWPYRPKTCRYQCNPNLTWELSRSTEELFDVHVGHSSYNPSVVIGLS